jgi:hypothetical protein
MVSYLKVRGGKQTVEHWQCADRQYVAFVSAWHLKGLVGSGPDTSSRSGRLCPVIVLAVQQLVEC